MLDESSLVAQEASETDPSVRIMQSQTRAHEDANFSYAHLPVEFYDLSNYMFCQYNRLSNSCTSTWLSAEHAHITMPQANKETLHPKAVLLAYPYWTIRQSKPA